jgi:transcriptional regulator with XRE-family HTH domain
MPTKERLASIGTSRGRWLVRLYAEELKHARLAAGLSQARVAVAAGVSQRAVSRYEAGEPPYPDFVTAARLAAVVGLELKLQCFSGPVRLRDAAHVALIGRFLERLPNAVVRRLEAPVSQGDQRAWDVLLVVVGIRIGVIAETRVRDLQALLRREHRKQMDSGVDLLILLLADTRHNRHMLHDAATLLTAEFPLGTRTVMAALARGEAPTHNGVVVL